VIVPRVSKEPTLVFRAAARDETNGDESSFVCVPIGFDRRVVGALGVNLKFKADRNYDRSKAFFSVAASMIGQALKVQRLVAAQHKRLVNVNAVEFDPRTSTYHVPFVRKGGAMIAVAVVKGMS